MEITHYVLSHRERALLIGDHGAYRAQLSRQLRTLRRQLGRATPKNAQFSNKPITAENVAADPTFTHLLLLSAERAWAHAIHMKTSHVEDSSAIKVPGSRRSHVVSRLVKAAKQAQALVSLLEDEQTGATTSDWLEAKAYSAYLLGLAELEKHAAAPKAADAQSQRQKWQACLQNLSTARIIYAAFNKKTKKDYFKDIITTSIDPSMRFAAYQSQIPRTVPVTAVSRKYFPTDDDKLVKALREVDVNALEDADVQADGSSALPTTITWRSRKANIVDASISQALLDVSNAEQALQNEKPSKSKDSSPAARAAAYDEVIIASQDAADATRHAIEEHEKERIPESDARMQDLRVTSLAVNYDMIGWRVGRNRVLIGVDDGRVLQPLPVKAPRAGKKPSPKTSAATPKPEGRGRKLARLRERTVLYDAILQSIDSIKELRGAARDEKFIAELDGKRSYFQALKCLNIAYSHDLFAQHTNALALVVRAHQLATSAVEAIAKSSNQADDTSSAPLRLDVSSASAKSLDSHLENLTHRYTGLVDLQRHEEQAIAAQAKTSTGSGSGIPLIRKLHEYPAGGVVDLTNLVTYPPRLEPVPVKPLFYDFAFNYIEYPGLESAKTKGDGAAKAQQQETKTKSDAAPQQQEAEKPKKGWFGFGR